MLSLVSHPPSVLSSKRRIRRSHHIMQIQYLRSLGYSVKEITILLKTADRNQSAALYREKAAEHLASIRRSTYAAEQLHYYQAALEHGSTGLWYIVQKPAIYFLPHTNGEEYIRTDETAALMKLWNKHTPSSMHWTAGFSTPTGRKMFFLICSMDGQSKLRSPGN